MNQSKPHHHVPPEPPNPDRGSAVGGHPHEHRHGPRTGANASNDGTYAAPSAHGGHDKHAGHSVAMFRDKFWISLLLTIPTLIWGHMLPRAFGYTPPAVPGGHWIPALFGTAVFFYGGWVFVQGAVRELRDRTSSSVPPELASP
jgi:Cu2+-exporting ATPase